MARTKRESEEGEERKNGRGAARPAESLQNGVGFSGKT